MAIQLQQLALPNLNLFFVLVFKAFCEVKIAEGCAEAKFGDGEQRKPEIPKMSWLQTPSIVKMRMSKIMEI